MSNVFRVCVSGAAYTQAQKSGFAVATLALPLVLPLCVSLGMTQILPHPENQPRVKVH